MRLPWISREHYEAVLSAKDALIRTLEVQNAALLNRMSQDIHIDLKMPETPRGAREEVPESSRVPRRRTLKIDWTQINEDDPEELAKIAAAEIGTHVSPYALSRYVSSLRANIKRAKLARQLEGQKMGSVTTLITAIEAGPVDEDVIPQDIKDRISDAERG